jgi:hypothetical protein
MAQNIICGSVITKSQASERSVLKLTKGMHQGKIKNICGGAIHLCLAFDSFVSR